MATARKEVVKDGVRAVYHCTARCVRQAFLCGQDSQTGKNYQHRRAWFRCRLIEISRIFTIDVLAFAAMGTHHHEVIRTRPDLAEALTDEEVARRWMLLFPKKRTGTPEQIQQAVECDKQAILRDERRVATLRRRLSSVSWFMKSLNEYIARRANAEDGVKGRFWEGRFTCQRLEDDAAILTCMAYVDLNPVRAKLASSLEDSQFTSAYDRVTAVRARERQARLAEEDPSEPTTPAQKTLVASNKYDLKRADWLADLDGPDRPIERLSQKIYLRILDEAGRKIRDGKRGAISPEITPILEVLEIDAERWVQNVENYGNLFYRIAGTVEELVQAAAEAGKRWFRGKAGSRELFQTPICEAAQFSQCR